MNLEKIRNFSIIAHIDHGKSTLADRMLEVTNTVEERKMQDQLLDQMELERERGITIKMQPVRMEYSLNGEKYRLNLIDTPGHIDFSYEVSRALKAVEGVVLLIDATQGVQAQTLTTLNMAKSLGLPIIPTLSKIDSPLARVDEVREEVCTLLDCESDEIFLTSGKTGEGVSELLDYIIKKIPAPKELLVDSQSFRGLVFDFKYSTHRGIIVYIRVLDGELSKNQSLIFKAVGEKFNAIEVGYFSPDETPTDSLKAGEIGYIVTGIKKPGVASVGDTVTLLKNQLPSLEGYMSPKPVVWASLYPEDSDDFNLLKQSLDKLRLSDSSFSYEEEASGSLGRGFRCGFLGMLHLEIVTERLRREFNLSLIITHPSIVYDVVYKKGGRETIYSPSLFPDYGDISEVFEPWVLVKIIAPSEYISPLMQLLYEHEAELTETEVFGDNRSSISLKMPLRELMRNFFDEVKSTSSGYASLSYEVEDMRLADVARLDILVAEEIVPAFSRVVSKRRVQEEAEKTVEKLYKTLSRQMFTVKIQAQALGRILSSKTLSAFKKDVTAKLYGGDVTRKMKLLEKQKKGKKKMSSRGKVNISQDVFLKMMKAD
ncbi:translation elongation factor 4 [Patescibacteria group bacterium]